MIGKFWSVGHLPRTPPKSANGTPLVLWCHICQWTWGRGIKSGAWMVLIGWLMWLIYRGAPSRPCRALGIVKIKQEKMAAKVTCKTNKTYCVTHMTFQFMTYNWLRIQLVYFYPPLSPPPSPHQPIHLQPWFRVSGSNLFEGAQNAIRIQNFV